MEQELTILAETAQTEDDRVDFKNSFAPEEKAAFWAEIVKDIVAIANTRGGAIVFGINDDGTLSDHDVSSLFSFDPAKITDQIAKWTGVQFSGFKITTVVRASGQFPAIIILPTRLPIVFTKVGTYSPDGKKQKTAFSLGTIYFRHGAKSEPAIQDDVRAAFQRELARVRQEWLGNIRQVVEADPGSQIVVNAPSTPLSDIRLSNDPNAPAIRVRDLSETHPYLQSEALKKIKSSAHQGTTINSHDIQCIKLTEGVDPNSRPDLVHKSHEKAAPQYSEAFIELVAGKVAANSNYLRECRDTYKKSRKSISKK